MQGGAVACLAVIEIVHERLQPLAGPGMSMLPKGQVRRS